MKSSTPTELHTYRIGLISLVKSGSSKHDESARAGSFIPPRRLNRKYTVWHLRPLGVFSYESYHTKGTHSSL